jgi:hypothetical protein
MTEQAHLDWDQAHQALVNAEAEWRLLLAQTPDTMAHTAARNRIVMALDAIANAQDFAVAARARMPKDEQDRA